MQTLHPTEARWFAISTRSKSEKVVHRLLQQQGVNAYVPIHRTHKLFPSGRKRWVEKPLISCYAFVRITSKEYTKVLRTDHVVKFVRLANDLKAIPDAEIDILRQVTGEIQIPMNAVPYKFHHGEEVEILFGPLTGMLAKLIERRGQKQVVIELQNVGYSLQLTLHPRHIRPAWMKV